MSSILPSPVAGAALAIAVADDMRDLQVIAREWLAAAGHQVACFSNGAELCRAAAARRFDVVVTDIIMPERDGFEVIAELKRTTPAVRIVAMSGGGNAMWGRDCLRAARQLGADAVLAKPFTRKDLLAAIQTLFSE